MELPCTLSVALTQITPTILKSSGLAGIWASFVATTVLCVLFLLRINLAIFGKTKKQALDFSRVQSLLNLDITKVSPYPYRPWKAGKYNMTMGIRKMSEDEWLTIDKHYAREQKFKEHLLETDTNMVLQCLPDAEEACKETLECIVSFLTRRYPSQFYLLEGRPGYVFNAITQRALKIVAPFEQHPLVIAAQLAMEDMNLLIRGSGGEPDEYYLQASFTFAPAGWYLQERIGWPLWKIHAPVPLWNEKLKRSMQRFFLGMKVSNPVERNNFFIQTNDNLFQQEPFPVTLATRPKVEAIHVRYERQTLRRLPRSGAILFMVRTYLTPLVDLKDEKENIYRLRSATRAWPPNMAEYKGRKAWAEVFEEWCDGVLADYTPATEKESE